MTDAEFWALPPEKRDEYLSACEAGWKAAEEWRDQCRDWSRHAGRVWAVLCGISGLLVLTNAGWLGVLYLAAMKMGAQQ
ncbi:MAG: hypothetical protein ACLGJC_09615 [Alphaproteobacteria bacterium]